MKVNPSFYRNKLLPALYDARKSGVNINEKVSLAKHFEGHESVKAWVCLSSQQELENTAKIVRDMEHSNHDILADYGVVASTVDDLVRHLYNVLGKSAPEAKDATADQVKKLSEKAVESLTSKEKDKSKVIRAVTQFLDEMYFSDLDYKAKFTAHQIHASSSHIVTSADLYYKNSDDDYDTVQVSGEIDDFEIQKTVKELFPS